MPHCQEIFKQCTPRRGLRMTERTAGLRNLKLERTTGSYAGMAGASPAGLRPTVRPRLRVGPVLGAGQGRVCRLRVSASLSGRARRRASEHCSAFVGIGAESESAAQYRAPGPQAGREALTEAAGSAGPRPGPGPGSRCPTQSESLQ